MAAGPWAFFRDPSGVSRSREPERGGLDHACTKPPRPLRFTGRSRPWAGTSEMGVLCSVALLPLAPSHPRRRPHGTQQCNADVGARPGPAPSMPQRPIRFALARARRDLRKAGMHQGSRRTAKPEPRSSPSHECEVAVDRSTNLRKPTEGEAFLPVRTLVRASTRRPCPVAVSLPRSFGASERTLELWARRARAHRRRVSSRERARGAWRSRTAGAARLGGLTRRPGSVILGE